MTNTIKLSILIWVILLTLFTSCTSNNDKTQAPPKNQVKDTSCKSSVANSSEEKSGTSLTSEITCPKCGHKKVVTLPTEICLLSYTCENCKEVLHPKDGDCCVFCTYGDYKCPSMQ